MVLHDKLVIAWNLHRGTGSVESVSKYSNAFSPLGDQMLVVLGSTIDVCRQSGTNFYRQHRDRAIMCCF